MTYPEAIVAAATQAADAYRYSQTLGFISVMTLLAVLPIAIYFIAKSLR